MHVQYTDRVQNILIIIRNHMLTCYGQLWSGTARPCWNDHPVSLVLVPQCTRWNRTDKVYSCTLFNSTLNLVLIGYCPRALSAWGRWDHYPLAHRIHPGLRAYAVRGSCSNPNPVAVMRIRSRFGRFRAVFRPNMRPECLVLAIWTDAH